MADAPFADVVDALTALLQVHSGLAGVDVSSELDPVTADQCPTVQVVLTRADYVAEAIGVMTPGAGIDRVTLSLGLVVTAFSAQSVADACRQRDRITTRVLDALRQYPTLNGVVDVAFRRAIDFGYRPGDQEGSLFAVATITVDAQARV